MTGCARRRICMLKLMVDYRVISCFKLDHSCASSGVGSSVDFFALNPSAYCHQLGRNGFAHSFVEILVAGGFAFQYAIIGKRRRWPVILRSLHHGNQLLVSSLSRGNNCQIHTLRPHGPNSCTLPSSHFNSFIPSTMGISIASYSSVIVGKKNTSRPPGTSIYRASRIRSSVKWVSSYGREGGR